MKKRNLKLSALFLLLGLGELQAQEAVIPAGAEGTGTGGSVSYSVGQVVYITNNGVTGSEAQGVQQPYEISAVTGIEHTNINLELSVYPNPTTGYFTLKVEDVDLANFRFQLYDIQGKLLKSNKITTSSITVNMIDLPVAVYFLKVIDNVEVVKTFKIIKN